LTVDALLSIQKIALESVNARKKCSIVSLDLCKAYDTVDNKLLIMKLVMNGLDDISLYLLKEWLKSNKLLLNENKSFCLLVYLNDRNLQDMVISIDGQLLPRVKVFEILSIYFDDRMCFDHHIDKTSSKVLQRLGLNR
jgi:hypothetical protein